MPYERRSTNRPASKERGASTPFVVGVVLVMAILLIGAAAWWGSINVEVDNGIDDTHTVDRGNFQIVIPASGELSANRLIEIRNPLETKGVITEIVAEGTFVSEGEVLIKFNEDELEQKIKDTRETRVNDTNRVVTTEQSLAIAKSTMESELEKADLAIEIAQLALQAWQEGEHIQQTQKLELALETARINAERLARRFEEARELVDNGFISRDEYERDRIAKIESAASVKQAEIDLDVYIRFSSKQDEKQKLSDVDQALAERARVKQRHEAELVTQNANVSSAKAKQTSTNERLAELEEQLDLCIITAPTDGLVVYKTSMQSDRGWRSDESPPTIGTSLSPNELVILLPDTTQMIANVKVSEALSGRIQEGMDAVVYSDALPNTPISGKVQAVSVLAEGGGWRDPNRRDYTVRIALETDPSLELKPSMRCRSEIQLGIVKNAISVPIQSVFREGPLAFVYVPDGSGWSQKKVKLGRSSELSVEIINGVDVGDTVLLREPEAIEVISRLSENAEGGPPGAGGPPAGMGRPGGGPPSGSKPQKPSDEHQQGGEKADSTQSKGPPRKTAAVEDE